MTNSDDDLDLGDIFEEPPRPPSPEPTFAVYERRRVVEGEGGRLNIRLVGSHPLWGHYLWNSARCLAAYLEENPALYRGKTVLELGAGGALPSLIAALHGASCTVITDYPDFALVANMQSNISSNLPSPLAQTTTVLGYVWGSSVAPLLAPLAPGAQFDLVLLSDLVFNHSQHAALLTTCERVTSPTGSSVVLAFYTHHRPRLAERDLEFFRLAEGRGWSCEEFYEEKQEPMFADDPGDVVVRSTVHGWRMRRAATDLDVQKNVPLTYEPVTTP